MEQPQFQFDPASGMYYADKPSPDPSVRLVTWYNPADHTYRDVAYPVQSIPAVCQPPHVPVKGKKSPLVWILLGIAIASLLVGAYFALQIFVLDKIPVPDAGQPESQEGSEEEALPPQEGDQGVRVYVWAVHDQAADYLYFDGLDLAESYPYRDQDKEVGEILYRWTADFGNYVIGIQYPNPDKGSDDPDTITPNEMTATVWTKDRDDLVCFDQAIAIIAVDDKIFLMSPNLPEDLSFGHTPTATLDVEAGEQSIHCQICPSWTFSGQLAEDYFQNPEDVAVAFDMADFKTANSVTITGLHLEDSYDLALPFADFDYAVYGWGILMGDYFLGLEHTSAEDVTEGSIAPGEMHGCLQVKNEDLYYETICDVDFDVTEDTLTFYDVDFGFDVWDWSQTYDFTVSLTEGYYLYTNPECTITGLTGDPSPVDLARAEKVAQQCDDMCQQLDALATTCEAAGYPDQAAQCLYLISIWEDAATVLDAGDIHGGLKFYDMIHIITDAYQEEWDGITTLALPSLD